MVIRQLIYIPLRIISYHWLFALVQTKWCVKCEDAIFTIIVVLLSMALTSSSGHFYQHYNYFGTSGTFAHIFVATVSTIAIFKLHRDTPTSMPTRMALMVGLLFGHINNQSKTIRRHKHIMLGTVLRPLSPSGIIIIPMTESKCM